MFSRKSGTLVLRFNGCGMQSAVGFWSNYGFSSQIFSNAWSQLILWYNSIQLMLIQVLDTFLDFCWPFFERAQWHCLLYCCQCYIYNIYIYMYLLGLPTQIKKQLPGFMKFRRRWPRQHWHTVKLMLHEPIPSKNTAGMLRCHTNWWQPRGDQPRFARLDGPLWPMKKTWNLQRCHLKKIAHILYCTYCSLHLLDVVR